jgi:acyl-homoserine-lactone acylase
MMFWTGRKIIAGGSIGAIALLAGPAWAQQDAARDVSIRRDTYGVPHILARTDADAAYGLGFAHSEDDFATIEEAVLTSRGKLASLKGKDGVASDTLYQLLEIDRTVAARYRSDLPADVRRVIEGYAAGISHYATLHPEKVTAALGAITARDIVAISVFRGPTFYGLDTVLNQLASGVLPEVSATGSNGVVVAPSRSADGHTRLLYNAHQPYVGQFSWYEAVIDSKEGWHVAGGFFPGTPFLLGGHNAHLGWAATTNRPDLTDVYRLTINPANPGQYRLDGRWLPLEKRFVDIAVKQPDGSTATMRKELLWAKQGPAIRNAKGVFAVRYPTFGGAGQLLQYYRMNRATTLAEWQAAMQLRKLPNINYLYGDEKGNIGFVHNGLYPVRAEGANWSGVVPGDRSDLIWTKLRPWSDVPQIWNPKSGWLYNSNNTALSATDPSSDLNPKRFPKSMGLQMDMTNRAYRALETYGADSAITAQEFDTYKYDLGYSRRSDVEEIVTAILGADATGKPDLAQAQRIVRAWDHQSDLKNRSMPLVGLTWLAMRRSHGTALEGLDVAIALLKTHFGRLDPEWGTVNRLRRGDVDLALDGGPDAFRAIYGRNDKDGRLRAFNGDGYFMFIDWAPDGTLTSRSVHQFGSATLDATSPHYADQTGLFAAKQTKPVWFTEAQLAGHIERSYRPGDAR